MVQAMRARKTLRQRIEARIARKSDMAFLARRYAEFCRAMVCGETIEYAACMETLQELTQ